MLKAIKNQPQTKICLRLVVVKISLKLVKKTNRPNILPITKKFSLFRIGAPERT